MARKNPTISAYPADNPVEDKHEKMLDEMHSALHTLGSKIRKPFQSRGDKLLPKALAPAEDPEAALARAHIEDLHKTMKAKR